MLLNKKKLKILTLACLTILFLPSCVRDLDGVKSSPVTQNVILVSPCVYIWDTEELDELKELPLNEFRGCDIFTRDTALGILNNNEFIEGEAEISDQ